MKNSISILFLTSILISCSTFHVEKRHYRSGYHISWLKNYKGIPFSSKDKIPKELTLNEHTQNNFPDKYESVEKQPEIDILNDEKDALLRSDNKPAIISKVFRESEIRLIDTISDADEFQIKCSDHKITENAPEKKNSHGLYFFLFALIIPFIKYTNNRLYTISKWASTHKSEAQLLLAILSVFGIGSSYLLGTLSPFETNESLLYGSLTTGLIGIGIFKLKNTEKDSYLRKRKALVLLNLSTFSAAFHFGTQNVHLYKNVLEDNNPDYVLNPVLVFLLTAFLIVLVIACIIGLVYLSCALACSGMGALALVTLFGGSYFVIFLGIFAGLHLNRKKGQSTEGFAKKASMTTLFIVALVSLVCCVILFL